MINYNKNFNHFFNYDMLTQQSSIIKNFHNVGPELCSVFKNSIKILGELANKFITIFTR